MIHSQSFSGPLYIGLIFTNVYQHFSPLGDTRNPEGTWHWIFSLLPHWIKIWLSCFPWYAGLCYRDCSEHIWQLLICPLSLPETGKFFLILHHDHLTEFIEINYMRGSGMGPLRLWYPGVSHYHTSIHFISINSSKLPLKCFYQIITLTASASSKLVLN